MAAAILMDRKSLRDGWQSVVMSVEESLFANMRMARGYKVGRFQQAEGERCHKRQSAVPPSAFGNIGLGTCTRLSGGQQFCKRKRRTGALMP